MIYNLIDNFYLTDEQLANTPSRQHDIDEETEATLRIYGCELIQEAGILLKCPQAVMATGQVLFQRFYCRKSLKDFNARRMALACLFLATKLEENHRRTRDILMVFDRVIKRREGSKSLPLLIPETREYDQMKERVITYERILLKTFGFIIHAVHPHKYVGSFVHSLEGGNELQQLAWNILNDSYRTTLCVRFKGNVVAAGAIYLAARRLQVPLPDNPPWWEAFKVPTEQLVEVVLTLNDLYQRPKAHYIEVNPEVLRSQAVSGAAKQLTPTPEGNDSPAPQDSSLIRGGPDVTSQQQGVPPAAAPVATTTAGPPNAKDMLADAIAAAQQRLQGNALPAAAGAAPRPDPDVLSTVHQELLPQG
ncbi:CYCL1 protein [Gonium pectorale]|uniref:CYCL1 protein n=1 Tax=Gonium pectorale TaxID=33097 RepID=A0A150H289_GONPE|nr:CYCL1 protein [Gonium pectorale]|eukprot:KXZ56259.1 CYCL1 protein [Gonium pectorale]